MDSGNTKKDFEVIMEQLNEEDEEEFRFQETSQDHQSVEKSDKSHILKSQYSVVEKSTYYTTEYKWCRILLNFINIIHIYIYE